MGILPAEEAILNRTLIHFLIYSDDMVLLGNDMNIVRNLCTRLIEAASTVRLHTNEEKQST